MSREFKPMHKYQGGWIFAAIGAVASIAGATQAAGAAKDASRREAYLQRVLTGERLRQLTREQGIIGGQTKGAAAGSGVVADQGSVLSVLADQRKQFDIEKRITRKTGATRAKAALDRGQAVATQQLYSGLGQGLSLAGKAVDQYKNG